MQTPKPIKRALLSVSDKTGILDFATALHNAGVELLSTGGTAKLLLTLAYLLKKCLITQVTQKLWLAALKPSPENSWRYPWSSRYR